MIKDDDSVENNCVFSQIVSPEITMIKELEKAKSITSLLNTKRFSSKTFVAWNSILLLNDDISASSKTISPKCYKLFDSSNQDKKNGRPIDLVKKALNFDVELIINQEAKLDLSSNKREKKVNENANDIHVVKRQRSLTKENEEPDNENNKRIAHKTRKRRQNRLLFSFFNESEDHFNTTWRDIRNDHDLIDPLHYKYKLNAKKIGLMKSHLPQSHLPENNIKES